MPSEFLWIFLFSVYLIKMSDERVPGEESLTDTYVRTWIETMWMGDKDELFTDGNTDVDVEMKKKIKKLAAYNFLAEHTTKNLAFLINMKLVMMRAKTYHGCGRSRCDKEATLEGIAAWAKRTTETDRRTKLCTVPKMVRESGTQTDSIDGPAPPQYGTLDEACAVQDGPRRPQIYDHLRRLLKEASGPPKSVKSSMTLPLYTPRPNALSTTGSFRTTKWQNVSTSSSCHQKPGTRC